MMAITLQSKRISAGATRLLSVSFLPWLEGLTGTALLTGTPVVVEVTTTVLTLTQKAYNTSAVIIEGVIVPAYKAVQFKVAVPSNGGGLTYTISITVTTDTGETEVRDVLLVCS